MKGTRTKTVGNISINAITPEARELFDKLCEEYKEVYGKNAIDDKKSAYVVLYWAVRYSGLIGPNVDLDKLAEEVKAELTNGWTTHERKCEWEPYLEEEIKTYYLTLYALLKRGRPQK